MKLCTKNSQDNFLFPAGVRIIVFFVWFFAVDNNYLINQKNTSQIPCDARIPLETVTHAQTNFVRAADKPCIIVSWFKQSEE